MLDNFLEFHSGTIQTLETTATATDRGSYMGLCSVYSSVVEVRGVGSHTSGAAVTNDHKVGGSKQNCIRL